MDWLHAELERPALHSEASKPGAEAGKGRPNEHRLTGFLAGEPVAGKHVTPSPRPATRPFAKMAAADALARSPSETMEDVPVPANSPLVATPRIADVSMTPANFAPSNFAPANFALAGGGVTTAPAGRSGLSSGGGGGGSSGVRLSQKLAASYVAVPAAARAASPRKRSWFGLGRQAPRVLSCFGQPLGPETKLAEGTPLSPAEAPRLNADNEPAPREEGLAVLARRLRNGDASVRSAR